MQAGSKRFSNIIIQLSPSNNSLQLLWNYTRENSNFRVETLKLDTINMPGQPGYCHKWDQYYRVIANRANKPLADKRISRFSYTIIAATTVVIILYVSRAFYRKRAKKETLQPSLPRELPQYVPKFLPKQCYKHETRISGLWKQWIMKIKIVYPVCTIWFNSF